MIIAVGLAIILAANTAQAVPSAYPVSILKRADVLRVSPGFYIGVQVPGLQVNASKEDVDAGLDGLRAEVDLIEQGGDDEAYDLLRSIHLPVPRLANGISDFEEFTLQLARHLEDMPASAQRLTMRRLHAERLLTTLRIGRAQIEKNVAHHD